MTKSHLTEILRATVNERFTSTPSLFSDLRAGAEKGGLKQQAWGLGVEKPNELFWLLCFPGGLYPKDFQWPAEYGDFLERFGAVAASEPVSLFLPFELPEEAIKAPITELGFTTLKQAVKHEDVRDTIDSIVRTALAAPGCLGGRWAFDTDDVRKVAFVLGWESVEAHIALTQTETFKQERQALRTFVDHGEVVHVKFAIQNF